MKDIEESNLKQKHILMENKIRNWNTEEQIDETNKGFKLNIYLDFYF